MWHRPKKIITNHRRQYPHSNAPSSHIPSSQCRQHLSPAQLDERTQNNKMIRHKKKIERLSQNVN
jgi:hypothetical protein